MKKLTNEEINWATLFVLIFWLFLLLPWFWIAPLSAMAFDPGPSVGAYLFVLPILTHPVPVIIAAIYRKKAPLIVFIPLLNIIVLAVSSVETSLWKIKLTH
jgi:hypothetical protein